VGGIKKEGKFKPEDYARTYKSIFSILRAKEALPALGRQDRREVTVGNSTERRICSRRQGNTLI